MNPRSEYINKGLAKLKEEHTKEYQICLEDISKWTKFREDYEQLKQKLDTLANKIDYDIMVPFGSVAFMPGKLIHTNEIMVLLGDNWFAERSTKQASEIVSRRITQCNDTLAQFEKERKQFEQWLFSIENVREEIGGGDVLDIVEECDESEEQAWRERHRENVKKYHRSKCAEKSMAREGETEEEYWNRLEMNDAENGESFDLENANEESDISSSEESDISDDEEDEPEPGDESSQQTPARKSVQWKEADPDPDPRSSVSVPTVKIRFTEKSDPSEFVSLSSSEPTEVTPMAVIQSPSDIYKHFCADSEPKPLKSILKSSSNPKTSSDYSTDKPTLDLVKNVAIPKLVEQTQNKAFSGLIVEKESSTGGQEVKEEASSTRRISKFKQAQMSRKS